MTCRDLNDTKWIEAGSSLISNRAFPDDISIGFSRWAGRTHLDFVENLLFGRLGVVARVYDGEDAAVWVCGLNPSDCCPEDSFTTSASVADIMLEISKRVRYAEILLTSKDARIQLSGASPVVSWNQSQVQLFPVFDSAIPNPSAHPALTPPCSRYRSTHIPPALSVYASRSDPSASSTQVLLILHQQGGRSE